MPAQGLSFGSKANTVLDAVAKGMKRSYSLLFGNEMIRDIIAACATDAYAAASMRHDGNKKFSGKEYTAAVEAYTEGKARVLLSIIIDWNSRFISAS